MIKTKLTDAETAILEDAGVDVDERPDDTDPTLDYASKLADIRATSLTPAIVAQRLGITPGRVRQMIHERSLYAIPTDGRLHVPVYQLTGQTLVPNIARVNHATADLDPVSVHRWLTTADPDLEDMTPLDWLRAGRDIAAVLRVVPER